MGGDLGPQAAIDGAIIASKQVSNVKFIFFGNKKKIDFYIKKKKFKNIYNIVDTSQVISNETKPTDALRKYKNSSMFRAVQSVKDGKSHAIVSSGNTGALMVISTVLMKTIKGNNHCSQIIKRKRILSIINELLVLDIRPKI